MKKILIAALIALFFSLNLQSKEIAGIEMPESIQSDNQVLFLNGAGVIKKFLFKVYAIGIYFEKQSSDENQLLSQDKPYIIRLHFVRNGVGADKIVDSWNTGFEKSTGNNTSNIKNEISQFNSYFKDEVNENDIFQFEYCPGKGTKVSINNKLKGTIPGWHFKKALLGIWLGKDPRDEDVKEELLGK